MQSRQGRETVCNIATTEFTPTALMWTASTAPVKPGLTTTHQMPKCNVLSRCSVCQAPLRHSNRGREMHLLCVVSTAPIQTYARMLHCGKCACAGHEKQEEGWWAAHTCCDAQHQQQDARHAALGDQCTGATCSCAAQKSKPNAFDCAWHSWHRVRQHPYTSSTCCVCGLRMRANPTPASRQKAEDVRFGTAHPGARHTATSARAALK